MERTISPPSGLGLSLASQVCPTSALQVVLDMASDAVFFVTPGSLELIDANRAACTSLGYAHDELLAMRFDEIVPTLHGDGRLTLQPRRMHGESGHVTLRGMRRSRDGTELPVELLVRQIEADYGPVLVVVATEVRPRMVEPQPMSRDLFPRDELTGLPGRSLLEQRLPDELGRSAAGRVGVLFLDVDRFKQVNDAMGHLIGDRVLQAVAQRLVACLRPNDIAVRYGGDEFVALVTKLRNQRNAVRVAQRIRNVMRPKFDVGGHQIDVSASVGVAVSRDGVSAEELLYRADQAMYDAKAKGRQGHYSVYRPPTEAKSPHPSTFACTFNGFSARLPR
ncbi:MAG: diguanylate cyclase domain-containing protein [Pirellulales bacterium]